MLAHVLALGGALWLYAGGVTAVGNILGLTRGLGDEGRRIVLTGCGVMLFLRMKASTVLLGRRSYTWKGAFKDSALAAACQLGYAWVGAAAPEPLGGLGDLAGAAIFVLGSGLSTWAVVKPNRTLAAGWRRSPVGTLGRLAAMGDSNFLGDLLWGTGWALLTRSAWALAMPVALAATRGAHVGSSSCGPDSAAGARDRQGRKESIQLDTGTSTIGTKELSDV
jgi:hypothetical protein